MNKKVLPLQKEKKILSKKDGMRKSGSTLRKEGGGAGLKCV